MFFFTPNSIKDLFEINQGKNITSKDSNQESDVKVLNQNNLDFKTNLIEVDKLQSYRNFDENSDIKYELRKDDFLIQRTGGGYCKCFSVLNANFEDSKKIIISHNFLFARPRHDFPKEDLRFYHFILNIAIEKLLDGKKKNPNPKNIKYITIKEVEELRLPINFENNEIYVKDFNRFNTLYTTALKKYNNSVAELKKIEAELEENKNEFEKFKLKYKEKFKKEK